MPLKQKVDAILKDRVDTYESHTVSNGSEHTTSPGTRQSVNPVAFPNDMNTLLMEQFRTSEYRKLEEQLSNYSRQLPVPSLTDHQKRLSEVVGIPTYYLPLSIIFASEGAEIIKRFVLVPAMRVMKPDIFRYLDELRDHWAAYANLRCVWDESSPLLPEMLTFRSVGQTLKNVRAGRLSAVDVMTDIYMAEREQVRYSHVAYEYSREDLANPNLTAKDTYGKYMDRVLSTHYMRDHASCLCGVGHFFSRCDD